MMTLNLTLRKILKEIMNNLYKNGVLIFMTVILTVLCEQFYFTDCQDANLMSLKKTQERCVKINMINTILHQLNISLFYWTTFYLPAIRALPVEQYPNMVWEALC